MNVLRVNVAIPVPSRYSFVEKACVTLHLQTPHIAICRAVRSVRSNIFRLFITTDCSTAMSRDFWETDVMHPSPCNTVPAGRLLCACLTIYLLCHVTELSLQD